MDPQLAEPDLRSYVGTIARRKWLVAAVTLVFFGVAVAMSLLADPQYRVRARVQTSGIDASNLVLAQERIQVDQDRVAENQLAYLTGTELAFAVARAYEGSLSQGEVWNVEAVQLSDRDNRVGNAVEISLISSDPEEARNLVNVYATTYVEKRRADQQEELIRTLAVVESAVESLRTQIAGVEEPITDLEDRTTAAASDGNSDEVAALTSQLRTRRADLGPQLDGLRRQETSLQEQVGDLHFASSLVDGGGAQVISRASTPNQPISPNVPRNLAIGLAFGLFLGVAAAFLREYFDDAVRSKDMVEQVAGVPALGLIPKFDASESELVAVAAPSSPAAEAFRSLRTSVRFVGVDRDVRVVQVTSASGGEGKTVTACNLAAVLAQAGDRVVLVDGDLRRPRAEQLLNVPQAPGFTGVLIGEIALPQAIHAVDGVPNLSVLPSGQPPPNPSELLSGDRARRLMDVLAQTYDIVVIDSPPVLPVTDALVIARMADATLLATSANVTSKRALQRSVEVLRQMDARLVGTVVSSLAPDEAYSEPYEYGAVLRSRRRPLPGRDREDVPAGNGGERWPAPVEGPPQGPPQPEPWQPDVPTRS